MSVPAIKNLWKPGLIIVAVGFVYSTVIVKLVGHWWTDENYSHGLLIPFVIAYIIWSERGRFASSASRPQSIAGMALVVLAFLALLAGTAGAELFVQRTSLLLMVAGILVYFWGGDLLRLSFVPLFLFALAIPIPTIIFNKVAFPLQLFASQCAVAMMRLLDIPVLRLGNVIELMPLGSKETKRLEVVEACSGIRSLMTLVTLAVILAYFTQPKTLRAGRTMLSSIRSFGFWRAVILVLSAVPIAILTNAMRVSGTGILAHYYGTKVADGFFHTFSGWVVYIVAFLMLFAVSWILDRFGGRIGTRDEASTGGSL